MPKELDLRVNEDHVEMFVDNKWCRKWEDFPFNKNEAIAHIFDSKDQKFQLDLIRLDKKCFERLTYPTLKTHSFLYIVDLL